MSDFKAEILPEPQLIFGYGTKAPQTISGLRSGGPFDVTQLSRKNELKAILIYPKDKKEVAEELCYKLKNGDRQCLFYGFDVLFQQDLQIIKAFEIPSTKQINNSIGTISHFLQIPQTDIDIGIVIIHKEQENSSGDRFNPYFLIKSSLAKWGKPTQFLLVEKYESLSKQDLRYYLSNLALAIYAKAGGKPWALDIDSANNFIAEGSDLILGVGGTRVDGRNWFAFTTLFERNGTFDYWSSDITSQEEYVQSLKEQIKTAIDDYIREHPGEEIKTITFHIAGKKPGRKEQYAVKEAMKELGTNFNYALLHINTTSPFWVLDDKFITPPDGLKVYLTYKDFLIVPEGRREDGLPRRRLVRPLRVTVIEHTVPYEQIDTLIKEIYGLTRMNWRGFNACKIPVSVYYPRLLAFSLFQLRSNSDIETFESITHQVSLRRKPWFL